MRRRLLSLVPLLVASGACSTATSAGATLPSDRVLTTDMQGQVIRQSALNDRATLQIAAPLDKVWPALLTTYADLGIEANFADRPRGQYGARNYLFPRDLKGTRISSYFSCGASLTGELATSGTVTTDVLTTLTPTADGHTTAVVYVSGWARRNEGSSSGPVACSSTGKLEELIRTSLEKKVGTM
jgi:hypothetical protein